MLNYIRADLSLILRRVQRYAIVLLALIASMVYVVFIYKTTSWNSVNFVSCATVCLTVQGIVLGLFEMSFVFTEDFQAKTMQVAIGRGLSRRKVVLTKFLEFGMLQILDMVVLLIVMSVFGAFTGIHLLAEQVLEIFSWCCCSWLTTMTVASLTSIALFRFQKAGLLLILFLILSFDPVNALLSWLQDNNAIAAQLNLTRFTYESVNSIFRSRLVLTNFDVLSFIGILIYIIGAYALTCFLFEKQEMEF